MKMPMLIFDLPALRSSNVIGTSTDPGSGQPGLESRLDLEGVPAGVEPVEVDLAQRPGSARP